MPDTPDRADAIARVLNESPLCPHQEPQQAADETYPCGHIERVRGCGGCDPGAIEFVRDDGGPWRRVDARQPEPVERITDANGDELEHGADTDAQTAQQQDRSDR